jgi:two-component system phosphate regulon response regulator PhoB
MPELDGLQACRALKANPTTARTPVVFLSARAEPAHRAAGLVAGAAEYLAKPSWGVREMVRRLLGD